MSSSAQRYRVGNRYIGVSQCIEHSVFSIHGMGRGQYCPVACVATHTHAGLP